MNKSREPLANSNAYHEERNKEPEQHLWLAVLAVAMSDAFRSNNWSESLEAINWIKHDSLDFKKVCSMAGKSPAYVRERMLQSLLEREATIINKIKAIKENIRVESDSN